MVDFKLEYDGKIIARANDGSLTYFNQDASIASAGMAIVGNTLYVAGQKSDGSQALSLELI